MTAKVRKLAFDLGFRWMVPLQILVALSSDYFFLSDNQLSGLMTGGVMLSLQGASSYAKIALWRTLPVTRLEIGLARWWQMTGLPGIGIVVMMAAAFVLHAMMTAAGWVHLPVRTDAGAIMNGLLLQFFYPVFLTVFSLAIIFARTSWSVFAYAATVVIWAPWRDERLLAGVTLAAIGMGFFWMHRQISRGTRVYRLQPFMAARWRGKD